MQEPPRRRRPIGKTRIKDEDEWEDDWEEDYWEDDDWEDDDWEEPKEPEFENVTSTS